MNLVSVRRRVLVSAALLLLPLATLQAQDTFHRRGYKPPPPPAHIVVTVVKAFNGKPLPNAAVIFRASQNGSDTGNLEIKTDPDGRAVMDLIDAGSHVTVQVIAQGFATFADEFDVTAEPKLITAKLLRPRAQVSDYTDTAGQPAQVTPGVQTHQPGQLAPAAPGAAAPAPDGSSPTPLTPSNGTPQ